jgi:hypothetical protein
MAERELVGVADRRVVFDLLEDLRAAWAEVIGAAPRAAPAPAERR